MPRLFAMSDVTCWTDTPSCDARHLAARAQLLHHVLAMFDRNGEADADVAVGIREDLRVDPDQLALHVHERAARVAVVDRRVGLQEVLVAAVSRPPWIAPWR